MKYDINTMLPEDAFKKDPLGRIKLHGGGGGGGNTYNPLKDKQYKQEKAYLDTLRDAMVKNNQRMTPDQIIATLSPLQQNIVSSQQAAPSQPIGANTWGTFNQIAPVEKSTTIIPQPQIQPSGQFGYSPEMMMKIQQLLQNSSYLPSPNANISSSAGQSNGQIGA